MTSRHVRVVPSRIALLGLGLNSYTNPNVLEALRRKFPDYEIDWIDLGLELRQHKMFPLLHWSSTFLEYAPRVGLNPRTLKRHRHFSTYLFNQRSAAAANRISRKPYIFSMQIQSMFDASTPGLPHFVYTDNTMLANLDYGIPRSDLPVTDRWLKRERQIYHNATINFVMSRNVGRSLVEHYGCDQSKVICAYGGRNADVDGIEPTDYNSKNILFVGVEWERKGGPELLKAFRLVRHEIPDATLTIVGCSPDVNEPGCRIIGRVPPSKLKRYYAGAAIFCMPTRREPFGIAFIEAMAHKLPVVATNIAAIPDFVHDGKNGFLVSQGDIHSLAQSLICLLNQPARCQQMGEQSYLISRMYTWENVASIMRSTIERFVPELSGEVVRAGAQRTVRG